MHLTTTLLLLLTDCAIAQVPKGQAPGKGAGGLAGLMGGRDFSKPMFPAEYLNSTGTGKFPAHFFSDPGLHKHTIYAPKDLPAGTKTPILVWGNGGCMNNGLSMAPFLLQLASEGVAILTNGVPPKSIEPPTITNAMAAGQTLNENLMAVAIDWAEKQRGSEKWGHLDTTRIAAGGQSCGGLEAHVMALDKRVTTIGVFNSGSTIAGSGRGGAAGTGLLPLPNKGVIPNGSSFTVPTFLFLGGSGDVASAKGNKDYDAMPAGIPAWAGDYSKNGHGGTYSEQNGGSYGTLGSHWLKYVFFGNKESAEFFKKDKASAEGWLNLAKKNLDKIPVV